jgi:hypothetical protein
MELRSKPMPRTLAFIGTLVVVALACSATPAAANAGIGNPIKKAKEKLQQKVTPKEEEEDEGAVDNSTVVYDEVTLELTGERLDEMLAACRAEQAAQRAEQAAQEQREPIVARLDKLNDERSKLWDKNYEAIQKLQQKRDDVNTCLHDGYQEARDRKAQEYSQKALTDPKIREKFGKVAMEQNAAAARGDSAAISKINETLYSEILPSRADSAEVEKRCGSPPPSSPAEKALAELDKQIAAENDALRAIDSKRAGAQADKSGMTREQYAIAAERIQSYLTWKEQHSKGSSPGFSDDESKALDERRNDLRACFK